jgi:uncharacterized membrane protein
MLTGNSSQNKWVRPLVPLAIIVVAAVVLLYIGGIVNARGFSPEAAVPVADWLPGIVIAAAIIYGLYVGFADRPIWQIGTREVVYMAIGAALYGVLSWVTNVIFPLPSISLVSLRPAVVIPIFFGVAFGPIVGFFSGFVGNILGDALSGWGVYPWWDVGNGLMGLIPGLIVGFKQRKQALDLVTYVVGGLALLTSLLMLLNWSYTFSDFAGNEYMAGPLFWIPLLAGALIVGARFVFAKNEETAAAVVWGALGIFVGIGFAAFSGVVTQGTSPASALFGEFVPAAGSNLINTVILLPILLTAWNAAQARSGR